MHSSKTAFPQKNVLIVSVEVTNTKKERWSTTDNALGGSMGFEVARGLLNIWKQHDKFGKRRFWASHPVSPARWK